MSQVSWAPWAAVGLWEQRLSEPRHQQPQVTRFVLLDWLGEKGAADLGTDPQVLDDTEGQLGTNTKILGKSELNRAGKLELSQGNTTDRISSVAQRKGLGEGILIILCGVTGDSGSSCLHLGQLHELATLLMHTCHCRDATKFSAGTLQVSGLQQAGRWDMYCNCRQQELFTMQGRDTGVWRKWLPHMPNVIPYQMSFHLCQYGYLFWICLDLCNLATSPLRETHLLFRSCIPLFLIFRSLWTNVLLCKVPGWGSKKVPCPPLMMSL